MKDNKDLIIERFHQVKNLGYVKSNRCSNTGIGKTFEDYIGVVENNIDAPDLAGFEIKAHREEVSSYITLFTKSPIFPKGANAFLNSRYGTPYDSNPNLNRLHTSMFASKYNTYNGRFSFRLINDKQAKIIKIGIYSVDSKCLLDSSVGYTYSSIERILAKKLKNLFYVSAERKYKDGDEYFNFNKAEIYTDPSLDKFLNLLDAGLIMYDIRIGSYQSGPKYGKPHDHGSGFRIIEKNIRLLYDIHEEIE